MPICKQEAGKYEGREVVFKIENVKYAPSYLDKEDLKIFLQNCGLESGKSYEVSRVLEYEPLKDEGLDTKVKKLHMIFVILMEYGKEMNLGSYLFDPPSE